MDPEKRGLRIRGFLVGSGIGVAFGLWAVIFAGPPLATVGVVSVIAGVVCILMAMGLYFADEEEAEAEAARPTVGDTGE